MSDRRFLVTASAGTFMLTGMTGHEELGRPFDYEVTFLSKTASVTPAKLLGQPMALHVPVTEGATRYFHGLVSQLSSAGMRGRYHAYRARLRPWFWFLSYSTNCRVFQNKTVPEIAKEIFLEHGFSDFDESSFAGDDRRWEYLVQYRESDFNFVSRLFEQEGLHYYFEHAESKHTLVLAGGDRKPHKASPGFERVRYARQHTHDTIGQWESVHRLQAGTYVLDDYFYGEPRRKLQAGYDIPRENELHQFEVFDYPGEYETKPDGTTYAQVRLEELHSQYERWEGRGQVAGIGAGQLFKVYDYPETGAATDNLLIVEASYVMSAGDYESMRGEGASFTCSISAIPGTTPFRPARVTPRPSIAGYLTATVVGKSGDELTTDDDGRVKVHFHWDRKGPTDEKGSCWVRVAQAWAGSGWGTLHVPRIGQEVLVTFLDGDPDRPLITGSVYNGVNKPPWAPVTGHISGTKSESTPGGGGYNEISLDDSKGKELIKIHGQHDMDTVIENDKRTKIGKNSSETVGKNKKVEVTGDHTLFSHKKTNITSTSDLAIAGKTKGTIEIADELTIRVGAASITLKQTGEITVVGTIINMQGATSVAVQSAVVNIAGSASIALQSSVIVQG
jgi:type VI secretion system secreted protein VgrG